MPQPDGGAHWEGDDQTVKDPDEQRVLFGALDSFYQYAKVAHFNTTHVRRQSFYALPRQHSELLARPPFSVLETLDEVDNCIDRNAELAIDILNTGLHSFGVSRGLGDKSSTAWQGAATANDLDKARSTLKQFFRDWSEEGRDERTACYQPVTKALQVEREAHPNGPPLKVLVPGAGLARLVFDLCYLGFDTEGNEISYHQLLGSAYILKHCPRAKQHTIHPWVHSFSNHITRAHQLKSVLVPDIHPGATLSNSPMLGQMSMTASDFICLYEGAEYSDHFDAVATVFFLDTAPNIIRYLETMWKCLRVGGVLVNIGPLLWHFEGTAPGTHGKGESKTGQHSHGNGEMHGANNHEDNKGIAEPGSIELTDDEVVALVQKLGFEIVKKESGITTPYIHDPESMLQTVYKASHWVARKVAR
ncbi:N2227-like protein-domain-containing protein [Calycina marina]|uniref:carnosine N-methyltransferase n=1 Tax=Calycina marina TaxID=1763456 RepID=A0A9P8CID9_9HELO|nr:N2227-like protein-domain-containing protein [Calycina marina]